MPREELILVFVIHYLAKELRDNFDLLSPWQQVGERNPRHSGHLHVINDAHQFLQQAQREVGVFEAVDRQTTARLFITVLWQSGKAEIGKKTTKHQRLFKKKTKKTTPYQLLKQRQLEPTLHFTCRSVMMECCTSSFCSCKKWKLTAFSV